VLDVRTPTARKRDARRIPTAIVAQTDNIEEQLRDLAPDTEIVLYCT
jgi:rhodanese-related sulfurtransferase